MDGKFLDETSARQHVMLNQTELQSQKLETLGSVASGIAHEFNNLLMVILSNLDLARSGLPAESSIQELLRAAEVAGGRAVVLARQMRAFSTRDFPQMRVISMAEPLQEIQPVLNSVLFNGTRLDIEVEDDLPLVKADPGELKQAALNLILNASAAVGERDGRIHVRCYALELTDARVLDAPVGRVERGGEFVCLEVADNGSGMSSETVSHIFEEGYSTGQFQRGFGLAAVASIAANHDGLIEVESTEGEGTTTRLLLPALEQDS